ncbi:phage tail protein I [Halopseudomonas sp.]|uniref:phage tail protein I n=1 Tax=Halopseudomonas sp. TaxID=2901191 RepID=UPI003002C3A2
MSSYTPLPPNATPAERHLALVAGHVNDVPVIVREVWNADTSPADLLPWLARAVSIDVWDPEWTTEQKRAAIKASLGVHRKKGTIGAVLDALGALGFTAKVQEWFNQIPQADPYTYRLIIEVDQVGFDLEDVALLLEVVGSAKNLRSHLTEIVPIIRSQVGPVLASAVMVGTELRLAPSNAQEVAILNDFYAAEALLDTIVNVNLAQNLGE